MDFPGTGDSTEGFRSNTLTNMEADVMAAIVYMQRTFPVNARLVGFFGYSMGGRVGLELLANPETSSVFLAAAFLAPAASTDDLKRSFGGPEGWEELKAIADAEGFATFTTGDGQVQELSAQWFADLEAGPDPTFPASLVYRGRPSLVIYGEDDNVVSPSVSQAVAQAFDSEVVDATGDGHSYGFSANRPDVLNTVANALGLFFGTKLK
jgi:pimeloyl-ACP methyl ester carboxylesterase